MSEVYKVAPSRLAGMIMKLWIKRNWWWLALPPAACLVLAAAVDVKFTLIALIMVFLVIPPLMITVYYYHALAPEARMSVLPHRVESLPEGLRIVYEPIDDTMPARTDDFIPRDTIVKVTLTPDYTVYHLGRYTLLPVPR